MAPMDQATCSAFFDELVKIGTATKFTSNDRMLPKTRANMKFFVDKVDELDEHHQEPARTFIEKVQPGGLFDIMHGMRRWYSGQTMARKLLEHRDSLSQVMRLEPKDAVGVFRGFKVDKDHPLAQSKPGDELVLDVTRNHGFSSWSTTEAPTHRFSGGGKGKVGLVVRLKEHEGIQPVLAPPEHTDPWFNAFYEKTIGRSFRPGEGEYLISAPKVTVEVVRVKR